MSGSRVLWGQVAIVLVIVLTAIWCATEWTAWRIGFQAQLGSPWFEVGGLAGLLPADLLLVAVLLRRLCAVDLRRRGYHRRVGRVPFHCRGHQPLGLASARGEERRHLWLGAMGRTGRDEGGRIARPRWRPARTARQRLPPPRRP